MAIVVAVPFDCDGSTPWLKMLFLSSTAPFNKGGPCIFEIRAKLPLFAAQQLLPAEWVKVRDHIHMCDQCRTALRNLRNQPVN